MSNQLTINLLIVYHPVKRGKNGKALHMAEKNNKFPAVNLIVAMTENGLIGRDGGLPWKSGLDMVWFKKQTMGYPMIFGRETADKMGAGFPLKNRPCAVISRKGWPDAPTGTPIFSDLIDACQYFKDHKQIFIAGGEMIYRLALEKDSPWTPGRPLVDTVIKTIFPDGYADGDKYLDEDTMRKIAELFPHVDWSATYNLENQGAMVGYVSDDDDALFCDIVPIKSTDTLFPWIRFQIQKHK